jgi:hypothetical protein
MDDTLAAISAVRGTPRVAHRRRLAHITTACDHYDARTLGRPKPDLNGARWGHEYFGNPVGARRLAIS